ncbi:MAG: ankyrin repeat domain-containing protein [Hyphomonadaceae bacterium]|nr:ankyrin repeat domain-containing protein [Hyphomonadaceae bacterium]MBC6412977.1 ankyrin repeat domain-containing protein [Hyphomonadaceae bacterium]
MIRFLIIATLLGAGLYARNAEAQPDCNDWNSKGFFESATAADVNRCLAAGAEVEARDENGRTPLHWAAYGGNAETVAALIKAGAKIEARIKTDSSTPPLHFAGSTPLHLAARYGGNAETIAALIQAGARVNARNESGWTPLHEAAGFGDAEMVAALIKAGANIRAMSKYGRLPAGVAELNDKVKDHDIFWTLNEGRYQ